MEFCKWKSGIGNQQNFLYFAMDYTQQTLSFSEMDCAQHSNVGTHLSATYLPTRWD